MINALYSLSGFFMVLFGITSSITIISYEQKNTRSSGIALGISMILLGLHAAFLPPNIQLHNYIGIWAMIFLPIVLGYDAIKHIKSRKPIG